MSDSFLVSDAECTQRVQNAYLSSWQSEGKAHDLNEKGAQRAPSSCQSG